MEEIVIYKLTLTLLSNRFGLDKEYAYDFGLNEEQYPDIFKEFAPFVCYFKNIKAAVNSVNACIDVFNEAKKSQHNHTPEFFKNIHYRQVVRAFQPKGKGKFVKRVEMPKVRYLGRMVNYAFNVEITKETLFTSSLTMEDIYNKYIHSV